MVRDLKIDKKTVRTTYCQRWSQVVHFEDDQQTPIDGIAKAKEDGKSHDSPEPNEEWHKCWENFLF